jgi:hypothetical protein
MHRGTTTGLIILAIIPEDTSLLGITPLGITPLDIILLRIILLAMVIILAVMFRLGTSQMGSMRQVLIQPCRTREAVIPVSDFVHVGPLEDVKPFFYCLLLSGICNVFHRRDSARHEFQP